MFKEKLQTAYEEVKDHVEWKKPQSVGVARVETVLRPTYKADMVFIEMKQPGDLSNFPFLITKYGEVQNGQVVEMLVRVRRQTSLTPRPFRFISLGIPQECQLAIRPFKPETYGKITEEDEQTLQHQFQHHANRKNIFNDRALFIKAFRLNDLLEPLTEASLPYEK